ncbi:MAG: hypothetical protein DCC71_16790 [Proteobacteria bacterium]|nr:MAG: hypothetical protein DCC71_16790 [Pseudomonadota bacterium]
MNRAIRRTASFVVRAAEAVTVVGAIAIVPGAAYADTRTTRGDVSGEGLHPFASAMGSTGADLATGAMTMAIPLTIPPGRKNLTPELALVYSSDAGQSPFGYGWDLPLGRIERSTKYGAPNCDHHTAEFVLNLDGASVELVAAGGDTYLARVDESYLEAKAFPGQNRWEVYDRAGNTYRFALESSDSSARAFEGDDTFFQASPCAFTTLWMLRQVEDSNRNRIDIAYWKDDNTFYPERIEYGGNALLNAGKHPFRVSFGLRETERLHAGASYAGGVRVRIRRVLESISVSTSPDGVTFTNLHDYELSYSPDDGRTGRTFLEEISGDLIPTRRFEYSTSEFAQTPVQSPAPPIAKLRESNTTQSWITTMDMNGDGFPDQVFSPEYSDRWQVHLGGADGAFVPINWWLNAVSGRRLREEEVGDVWGLTVDDCVDITGDGIVDFVDAREDTWKVYRGQKSVSHPGDYEFAATPILLAGLGAYTDVRMNERLDYYLPMYELETVRTYTLKTLLDVNGDGLLDVVSVASSSSAAPWSVLIAANDCAVGNEGPCFEPAPGFSATGPIRISLFLPVSSMISATVLDHLDINGDAIPDRLQTGHNYDLDFAGVRPDWTIQWSLNRFDDCPGEWGEGMEMCPVLPGLLQVLAGTGRGFTGLEYHALESVRTMPGYTIDVLAIRMERGGLYGFEAVQDLADLNADGKPDRVRSISSTSSMVRSNVGGAFQSPENAMSGLGSATRLTWRGCNGGCSATYGEVMDWNGDGILDGVGLSGGTIDLRLGGPAGSPWYGRIPPSLLVRATDSIGGLTEVRYEPSTASGSNPELPFAKWVVSSIRRADGLCTYVGSDPLDPLVNPCVAQGHELHQHFEYENGRFDGARREFAGFGVVREIDAEGTEREITISQDEFTRGKILADVWRTASGLEAKRTEYTWLTRDGGSGRTQVFLAEMKTIERSGPGTGGADWCVISRNETPDHYGRVTTSCTMSCPGATGVVACGSSPVPGEVITRTIWGWAPSSRVLERPYRVTVVYGKHEGGEELLSEKSFSYDGDESFSGIVAAGNLTLVQSKLDESYADGNWPTSKSTYDDYGNVTRVYDPAGFFASQQYHTESIFDGWHLYPTIVRRPTTGAIAYETTQQWSLAAGRPVLVTGENGEVSRFEYDALGRITCEARPGAECSQTSPELASSGYRYVNGDPQSASYEGKLSYIEQRRREPNAPSGYLVSRTYYDALGRVRMTLAESVVGNDAALVWVVDGQAAYSSGGRIRHTYDRYLRPSSGVSENPAGIARTELSYTWNGGSEIDPLGRVHRTSPPDGRFTEARYNGTQTETLDSAGNKTIATRNHLGYETSIVRLGADGSATSAARRFDGMGRVVWERFANDSRTDVVHEFDSLGRLVRLTDPDSGSWQYGYDPNGNLVYRNDPQSGNHVAWKYDELNRVTARCTHAVDAFLPSACTRDATSADSAYYYDDTTFGNSGSGRLTRIDHRDPDISEATLVYGPRGELRATQTIVKNKPAATYFVYDDADHLVSLTYPGGEVVTHHYDAAGRLERMTSSHGGEVLSTADYDLLGRPLELRHGNGVTDSFEYYGSEESHRLRRAGSASSTLQVTDLEYRYGGPSDLHVGRIEEIIDHDDAQAALSNDASYHYDGLGRLRRVDWRSDGSTSNDETFDYSVIGNLMAKNGAAFTYDPVKPHQVVSASGVDYGFDENGNQVTRTAGSTVQSHAFDRLGRLRTVTREAQAVTFTYGADDRRIATTRPDGTHVRYFNRWAESRDGRLIKYYWVGDRLFASRDVPGVAYSESPPGRPAPSPPWLAPLLLGVFGGVVILIVFAPGPGERRILVWVAPARAAGTSALLLLASTPLLLAPEDCGGGPVVRHYHLDHLGSVLAKTNELGGIALQVRYRVYGEERGHYSGGGIAILTAAADRHEWTGYEREHEIGLDYAGARFYDAAIGQFLSHDPMRQYASPYAYGPGDPVNGIDPDGQLFGFLGKVFKGLKNLLGAASDAIDRALPSNVSGSFGIGYTVRFGGGGRASGGRGGAGESNAAQRRQVGEALAGYSRTAVQAVVLARGNVAAATAVFPVAVTVSGASGASSQGRDRLTGADAEYLREWTRRMPEVRDVPSDVEIAIRETFAGTALEGAAGAYVRGTDTILLAQDKLFNMAQAAGILVHENEHRARPVASVVTQVQDAWYGLRGFETDRPGTYHYNYFWSVGNRAEQLYRRQAFEGRVPLRFGLAP